MTASPDETRAALARQRVGLLRRETANLRAARSILAEMERTPALDARILEQSRRAVELATDAQRLGVIDAHRVGVPVSELAEVAQMDEPDIAAILDAHG
jgi:hypothetical protein